MIINNIREYEDAVASQDIKHFIAKAWDRLHVMSKIGHVDRLRMQDVITGLIEGQLTLRSGTVPSAVWNQSVKLAQSLGVR